MRGRRLNSGTFRRFYYPLTPGERPHASRTLLKSFYLTGVILKLFESSDGNPTYRIHKSSAEKRFKIPRIAPR